MKTTDIGAKPFPYDFHEQNTFICGKAVTLLSAATTQLSKLDAEKNTVLVTDPYLFPDNPNGTCQSDLITLLMNLKAAKIIYCAKSKRNVNFFQQVCSTLQASGTALEFNNQLEDCHDRFWYCPETEKCVVFGTSLNGIGRKICRIDMLTDVETQELKQFFVSAGIISGGSSGA